MIFFILPLVVQFLATEAVIPEYLPVFHAVEHNDAIEDFTLGFSASEILTFLLNVHGIQFSLRGCLHGGRKIQALGRS